MKRITRAAARTVTNGGLSGRLISVSVTAPIGATTTVFSTPKSGHFVLTQVGSALSGHDVSGVSFSVTNFGPLGSTPFSVTQPFQQASLTFTPGLALPPGASVQCSPFGGCGAGCSPPPTDCYLTGVLEK